MERSRKLIVSGFFANICEWYDYTIFAFLAPTLAKVFYPHLSDTHGLILTFFIFSLSYFVRPIGGLILGRLADRQSIKSAYKISLICMALPALVIAMLPTTLLSAAIVIAIFIGLRVIQGIAVGGEFPLLALYLFKGSNRNLFYSSFGVASAVTGVLLASMVSAILHAVLNNYEMFMFGWRIGFALAEVLAVVVFVIQQRTLLPIGHQPPNEKPLARALPTIVILLLTTGVGSFTFYACFVWLPNYVKGFYHVSHTTAFLLAAVNLCVIVLSTLWIAFKARAAQALWIYRAGIISTSLLFLVAVLLREYGIVLFSLLGIVLAIAFSLFQSSIYFLVCAQTSNCRHTGLVLAFAFSCTQALFGSTAPAVCTYLVSHFSLMSVAYIVSVLTAIGLFTSFFYRIDNGTTEML